MTQKKQYIFLLLYSYLDLKINQLIHYNGIIEHMFLSLSDLPSSEGHPHRNWGDHIKEESRADLAWLKHGTDLLSHCSYLCDLILMRRTSREHSLQVSPSTLPTLLLHTRL